MRWIKCEPNVELLGQREGHCAVTLVARDDNRPSHSHASARTVTTDPSAYPSNDQQYILVFGGYCEGELTGSPIISPVARLPRLRWNQLRHQAALECDGASVTNTDAPWEALMFGGLDADMDRRNTVYSLLLHVPHGATVETNGGASAPLPTLTVTVMEATGDVPEPRSRHGAGFSQGKMFVFGGETDRAEQTNDLYEFTHATGVWRRLTTASVGPPPRLLSLSLVFVTADVMVLYGGSHFTEGRVESFNDAWAYYLKRAAWGKLEPSASTAAFADVGVEWPRSNGHRGGCVSTTAIFVGGKDSATGDDRVKCIRYAPDMDVFKFSLHAPEDADGGAAEGEARERVSRPPSASSSSSSSADSEEDLEEASDSSKAVDAASEEDEEEVVQNTRIPHPHWRYTPALVEVPGGLLLLGGQCRHPQRPSVYMLKL